MTLAFDRLIVNAQHPVYFVFLVALLPKAEPLVSLAKVFFSCVGWIVIVVSPKGVLATPNETESSTSRQSNYSHNIQGILYFCGQSSLASCIRLAVREVKSIVEQGCIAHSAAVVFRLHVGQNLLSSIKSFIFFLVLCVLYTF